MAKHIAEMYQDYYLGSLTKEEADYLIGLQNIEVVEELKNCIYDLDKDLVEHIKEHAMIMGEQYFMDDRDIKDMGELRDYQTVGTAFAYIAKRMLLGDSVGLGKTIQIAGLINICKAENKKLGKKPFRYLFLTEKGSIAQIRDKLIRFTGEYVHMMTGEAKYIDAFIEGVAQGELWCSIVASHSILDSEKFIRWLTLNRKEFDLLVLDESYVVKSTKSGINKTTKLINPWFERFIMLNATPFEHVIEDFYNQIKLVDSKLLPTKTDFDTEFCKKKYMGYSFRTVGYKNTEVFRKKVSLRYFARTRAVLGAKFENNKGEVIFSDLSREQRYLMNRTTLWRLVCDCPLEFDDTLSFDIETVPKLKDLTDILANKVSDSETVLIYSYYKETQRYLKEFLEELGYSCEIINGETKQKEKESIIEDFNQGRFKILITNIQRGIDLTDCNCLIYYSFDFNPQTMVQVEGRITREFDIKDKNVYLLCSNGREKKYLIKNIQKKARYASQVATRDLSSILDILETDIK